jgi:hypothetical protein
VKEPINLRPLVNNQALYEDFLSYLDEQIGHQVSTLKSLTDPAQMYRAQGSISALERLKKLKEAINVRP